ncbi:hypothetical protein FN846DRAFT_987213 [Sphaerosporella brunnea]|uniref:Uncharacterized protein n=1 Tax=Sphaerosporella brunnea TaxID=1250544 RepID=A0A5J5ESX7_9PEZI|nr:hypothetical protein FN846DRAFT_987213 [Sphaerosporella brunnea]
MSYVIPADHVRKSTGVLNCACNQRPRIRAGSTNQSKMLKLAKSSLARRSEIAHHPGDEPRAEELQAEMSEEDELEHSNEFADLPAENELVDKEAKAVEDEISSASTVPQLSSTWWAEGLGSPSTAMNSLICLLRSTWRAMRLTTKTGTTKTSLICLLRANS